MNISTSYHPFRSEKAKTEYLNHYDQAAKEWPIPSESRMVDTSYGQTFVRISGPNDAPPLLLLPGYGCCSLMWRSNIKTLSENHKTYAVDSLINTGCVGKSVYTRPITNADEAVAWLDELCNQLNLKNDIHLMGGSYGGWLASQYAIRFPDRLNKVVLVAPAGTVLPFQRKYFLRSMLLNLIPTRNTYRRYFQWVFKDLAKKDSRMIDVLTDDFLVAARCFEPINPKQLPSLTALSDEELQNIKTPTLFLVGENEVLYCAQKAVQRLNEVAPNIQTTIIPNAGHDLLLVQTELINQKIVKFLAQP